MWLSKKFPNLVVFNIAWLCLVLFGEVAIPLALLWLVCHTSSCQQPTKELMFIALITAIGAGIDTGLLAIGAFEFTSGKHIPLWLVVLWACFSATINHSLVFLEHSKIMQWLMGAMIAPISYIAGYKLNAVGFGFSIMQTYLLLAFIWGLLMVLFFHIRVVIFSKNTLVTSHD